MTDSFYVGEFRWQGEPQNSPVEMWDGKRWILTEPQGPVPVAERLPGPEDCDAELCWIWNPETLWWELLSLRMIRLNAGDPYTHWLPHHALPVPTPANTTNQED